MSTAFWTSNMSLCGQGVRTTNVTINQAMMEIIAGASSRLAVLELGMINATAVGLTIGLGRPAAIGITPTTPSLLQRMDPADTACVGATALAWGTSPTSPVFFMRRFTFPAAIGMGVVWTWPKGLMIPTNGSVVLWNISATQASDVNIAAEDL